MSEIANLLRSRSEDIQEGLAKQAEAEDFLQQTKLAAVESLVDQGMDAEAACAMVKSAEELQGLGVEAPEVDLGNLALVLEKAAAYIEELEASVAHSHAKIQENDELSKQAALSGLPGVDALQNTGFSNEEVKMLGEIGLLEKVAHVAGTPWDMGSSSGRPAADTLDPLEKFCRGL